MSEEPKRSKKWAQAVREAEQGAAECSHLFECIVCEGDEDVIECRRCGRQRVAACTFDEDYD